MLCSTIIGASIDLTTKQLRECLKALYVGTELNHNYVSSWDNYNNKYFYYGIIRFYRDEISNKNKEI